MRSVLHHGKGLKNLTVYESFIKKNYILQIIKGPCNEKTVGLNIFIKLKSYGTNKY